MVMTNEERHQIVYAALLRYSPEAGSLRERILDHIVLVSLLDSSHSKPLRVRVIRRIMRGNPGVPRLRTDVIHKTLERLTNCNKVEHKRSKGRFVYYLTETGRRDTDAVTESAVRLFKPVLNRMLQDTSTLCNERDGQIVCRKFISECFSRFGQQIAKAVTGELKTDQLASTADVHGAFQAAISTVSLSDDAIQSLKARCFRFLQSAEPDDAQLKFRLTQNYYVAQLLGLAPYKFNPLAEDAFREAVFYIDTNVLLGKLLSGDGGRLFEELVLICKALGIELWVSRATIDETRGVAARRLYGLDNTLATVPRELVERVQRDSFLDAFLEAKAGNPGMTAEKFRGRFDEIPSLLAKLGIELHEYTADEIIGHRDVDQECEVVRAAAATKYQNRGKARWSCRHDVCHYLLVQERRKQGRKAWFLTQDKTLCKAASDLRGDPLPFCFPISGFLHSVSPFLEAPDAQRSLVDLFSAVLDGEIGDLSGKSLFDLSELKILSEFHTDVLSTPVEELIPACDYVKNAVLGGKPLRRSDHTKVALELKKFLTSSAEEKQKVLQAEAMRQKQVAVDERAKRELANETQRTVRLKSLV